MFHKHCEGRTMSVLPIDLFSAIRALSEYSLNKWISELMDNSILKKGRLILTSTAFLRCLVHKQELAMVFKMSKVDSDFR